MQYVHVCSAPDPEIIPICSEVDMPQNAALCCSYHLPEAHLTDGGKNKSFETSL